MSIIAMNPKFNARISSIPYFLFSSHTHASMEANEHGVGEYKVFCSISLRCLENFDH
jgi:hypothetical protein